MKHGALGAIIVILLTVLVWRVTCSRLALWGEGMTRIDAVVHLVGTSPRGQSTGARHGGKTWAMLLTGSPRLRASATP